MLCDRTHTSAGSLCFRRRYVNAMTDDPLFDEFELSGHVLDNRVGLAPMTRTSATDADTRRPTEWPDYALLRSRRVLVSRHRGRPPGRHPQPGLPQSARPRDRRAGGGLGASRRRRPRGGQPDLRAVDARRGTGTGQSIRVRSRRAFAVPPAGRDGGAVRRVRSVPRGGPTRRRGARRSERGIRRRRGARGRGRFRRDRGPRGQRLPPPRVRRPAGQ